MKFLFHKKTRRLLLLSTASVCQNLSAAWFGLALFSPGLEIFKRSDWFFLLTKSFILGIFFLILSVFLISEAKYDF